MVPITDHPLRYALANELHARPFAALSAPCHAAYLAIKQPQDAASRDRAQDRAHLIELLDRFGAQHPQPDATHYFGALGRYHLKWECHTEFVTYTIFADGVADRPFDPAAFEVFPDDWLEKLPGQRVTSALIRIEHQKASDEEIVQHFQDWFVPESLACSWVLDRSAIMASDFRIDSAGHMRFALFVAPTTGRRRIGRVVQRICEIEIYKAMSMLGFERARNMSGRMGDIDAKLLSLVGEMGAEERPADETLHELLQISGELEDMLAQSAFRFSATGAYEALVHQRIEVLREERFGGRQTFREFMMRRFDPAMRTVKSTERRLNAMSERAIRAGDLLRTRVDVERSAQNQELLTSMDRRSDLQLRLQRTVEGLSVVAISYYALNLVLYVLAPVEKLAHIEKYWMTAVVTPLVVLAVWGMLRRIQKAMH